MQPSRTTLAFRFVAVDVIGAILYFPVWWYTAGARKAARWCVSRLSGAAVSFGIGVWIKNLFTPMYGQRDIAGRIISFFMRLVTIFFYSFLLLLLVAVMALLFGLWLAVPALVAWQFWRQIVGVLFS